MNTANLTPAARTALTNVGTSRQGATVTNSAVSRETVAELKELGLIGPTGGLTMKGSILRDRIQEEDLEALLPL